jgi:threonine dehydratase
MSTDIEVLQTEVLQAEQRTRAYLRTTPLDYSLALSQDTGCNVFVKLDNLQHTGSFKVRGALSKLLSLSPEARSHGVVTASSGNHGGAIAFGLSQLKLPGIVFVPEAASPTKVDAIRRLGAEVRFHGLDSGITETYARTYAEQHDQVYVSPYNDLQVIGGQGTIAVELEQQLSQIDAVFVSVGGGGLISGIAGYLKSRLGKVQVIGCSPQNSAVMVESVKAGKILELQSQPTLSDGTAGGIEPGAITFEFCRSLVDQYVLVTEAEIRAAMRLFMQTHHQLVEGAAGVAIAAFLKTQESFRNQNVVLIICGANISLDTLKSIL